MHEMLVTFMYLYKSIFIKFYLSIFYAQNLERGNGFSKENGRKIQ